MVVWVFAIFGMVTSAVCAEALYYRPSDPCNLVPYDYLRSQLCCNGTIYADPPFIYTCCYDFVCYRVNNMPVDPDILHPISRYFPSSKPGLAASKDASPGVPIPQEIFSPIDYDSQQPVVPGANSDNNDTLNVANPSSAGQQQQPPVNADDPAAFVHANRGRKVIAQNATSFHAEENQKQSTTPPSQPANNNQQPMNQQYNNNPFHFERFRMDNLPNFPEFPGVPPFGQQLNPLNNPYYVRNQGPIHQYFMPFGTQWWNPWQAAPIFPEQQQTTQKAAEEQTTTSTTTAATTTTSAAPTTTTTTATTTTTQQTAKPFPMIPDQPSLVQFLQRFFPKDGATFGGQYPPQPMPQQMPQQVVNQSFYPHEIPFLGNQQMAQQLQNRMPQPMQPFPQPLMTQPPLIEETTDNPDLYCDGINLVLLQQTNPNLACCAKMVIYDSRLYSCVESDVTSTTTAASSTTTKATPSAVLVPVSTKATPSQADLPMPVDVPDAVVQTAPVGQPQQTGVEQQQQQQQQQQHQQQQQQFIPQNVANSNAAPQASAIVEPAAHFAAAAQPLVPADKQPLIRAEPDLAAFAAQVPPIGPVNKTITPAKRSAKGLSSPQNNNGDPQLGRRKVQFNNQHQNQQQQQSQQQRQQPPQKVITGSNHHHLPGDFSSLTCGIHEYYIDPSIYSKFACCGDAIFDVTTELCEHVWGMYYAMAAVPINEDDKPPASPARLDCSELKTYIFGSSSVAANYSC